VRGSLLPRGEATLPSAPGVAYYQKKGRTRIFKKKKEYSGGTGRGETWVGEASFTDKEKFKKALHGEREGFHKTRGNNDLEGDYRNTWKQD